MTQCPNCKGTGKISGYTCLKCGGTGKIDEVPLIPVAKRPGRTLINLQVAWALMDKTNGDFEIVILVKGRPTLVRGNINNAGRGTK